MATVSYERDIILTKEAAERLADVLTKPALPEPESNDDFWRENERNVEEWLTRYK